MLQIAGSAGAPSKSQISHLQPKVDAIINLLAFGAVDA
jgi:hypothetical protein